jgi:hypothetical protein
MLLVHSELLTAREHWVFLIAVVFLAMLGLATGFAAMLRPTAFRRRVPLRRSLRWMTSGQADFYTRFWGFAAAGISTYIILSQFLDGW